MSMDVMEYMLDKSRPENSVHYGKTKRFEKAKEEYTTKQLIEREQIVNWVNEYLEAYGLKLTLEQLLKSEERKKSENNIDKFIEKRQQYTYM